MPRGRVFSRAARGVGVAAASTRVNFRASVLAMKRAAPRGARRSSNAFHRVRDRELGIRPRRFFDAIPARLATPVERLVDPAGMLYRCVILGFLSAGDHLVSYTCADGRHELQLWGFRLGRRAWLVATVPLFATSEGEESATASGDAEEMLGDAAREQLRISVCESCDGEVLLVHGEPTSERAFGSSEAPVARRCFLTAVPSPAAPSRAAARAPLDATHMSYLTTSAAPFQPRIVGLVPAEDESPGTHYAAVNAGDAVVAVRLSVDDADDDDPSNRRRGPAGARLEALLSHSPGPTAPVRWATAAPPSTSDVPGTNPSPSRTPSSASMRAWTAMEVDAVLTRALAATLRLGYSVVDYEVHVLGAAHGAGGGAGHSLASCVVSVLRSRAAEERETVRREGKKTSHPPQWRVVASVVECPLAPSPPPPPRLLFSVEVSTAGGANGATLPHRLPTSRAVAAARARLAAFRRAARVPVANRVRNAATLTNANVVAGGQSVSAIKHQSLPVCILGWRGGGAGTGA